MMRMKPAGSEATALAGTVFASAPCDGHIWPKSLVAIGCGRMSRRRLTGMRKESTRGSATAASE